jgi:crossover junction endodeoxyribonuclease RusA
MAAVLCQLPWPPSANHAWRATNGSVHVSEDYRAYKKAVGDCVLEHRVKRHWTREKLAIGISLRPPDQRSFDIDNRVKTLIDALCCAGVIFNDRDIDWLVVARGPIKPGGCAVVKIEELKSLDLSVGFEHWFPIAEIASYSRPLNGST